MLLGNWNFCGIYIFFTFCMKRDVHWPLQTIFAWIQYFFKGKNYYFDFFALIFGELVWCAKPTCTGCWTLFEGEHHQILTKIAWVSEFKERTLAPVSERISDDPDRAKNPWQSRVRDFARNFSRAEGQKKKSLERTRSKRGFFFSRRATNSVNRDFFSFHWFKIQMELGYFGF